MRASVTSYSPRLRGFATLLFTLVILTSLIGFSYVSASTTATHQRVILQDKISTEAFNAAQAGLDYGVPYLTSNYSSITDGSQVNFTNGDGSSTNINFAFVGSKDLIRITATGTSSDGSSRTLQQQVKYETDSGNASLSFALQSQGGVTMKNNAVISDLSGSAQSILSGGNVTLKNNAQTVLSTGVASVGPDNIGSDIVMNDLTFAATSDTDLFLNFLNAPFADFQDATVTMTFSPHSGNYTYSNLTNLNGVTIQVDQSNGVGSTSNNAVLGTTNSPTVLVLLLNGTGSFKISNNAVINGKIITNNGNIVLDNNVTLNGDLIVDGDVTLNNNVTVNGDVIATGTLNMKNNATINGVGFALSDITLENEAEVNGAVLSGGSNVYIKNTATITYNPSNAEVTNPSQTATTGSYGKISGSWTDFSS